MRGIRACRPILCACVGQASACAGLQSRCRPKRAEARCKLKLGPALNVVLRHALSLIFAAALLAQDSVESGVAAFHLGKYAEAERILAAAPAGPHQRVFLALSRAALGGCEAAAPVLSAAFGDEKDKDLHRLAGLGVVQCLAALNKNDDALAAANRLKAAYPGDADVLYQAARLHMRLWNDVMFQMFEKAPASYRVNQISAEVLETQGQFSEAVAEYRKAIEKNPVAINLHYRLGRALLMQAHAPENLELARKEFEGELALNPNDAVAEYQIAQILQTQGKGDAAAAKFERAIALRPGDFPEAMIAVAKIRAARKQFAEAIALLEKAVTLQPANESAHYALMLAYRNAGRAGDASREAGTLEKLRRPPEGEFTNFLKRLGEKAPKQ